MAGWISATQTSAPSIGEDGSVTITFIVDDTGEERIVTTSVPNLLKSNGTAEELPPLRNPPLLEAADDLTGLSHLNEGSVLHTIMNRYQQRMIYTYSGIVLIAVNPFFSLNLYSPEIIQAYAGKRKGELEPHLFAVAEDAYRCMMRDQKNQTIVVSGESGAGKTMSAKYIMRYFATVEDPDKPRVRRSESGTDGMSATEEAILATNPIMEAFGNAKTTRNDNSSRFGKYLEIIFDKNYEIAGAKMRTYLLERSRLVYQPEIERNYHIFYQLCAGAPQELKDYLALAPASEYHYLRQGGAVNLAIAGVDDAEEFRSTERALATLGLGPAVQMHIFSLLAALLHLGNIVVSATRSDAAISSEDPSLLRAADTLGVDPALLRQWMLKRQMQLRGEKIMSNLSQTQATAVRDSVAKYVYTSLFDWLVVQMNKSLAPKEALEHASMIGVLDIYGFECFKQNSYEQFCINYANERLQHEFNRHVFKLEQEEYIAEQIPWEFIDFSDNQPCIDMIESKFGILSLLDEESRLPNGSDTAFLEKVYAQIPAKEELQPFLSKPRFGAQSSFSVRHYALDVTYEVDGFMEKNKDTVPDELLALLAGTSNEFLGGVLAAQGSAPEAAPVPGRKGPPAKKPTLGSQFKGSLGSLMDTINSTEVHYIRCIKPNDVKVAWEVEPQNILGQLRACGVLETIRISCAGYPSRWDFTDFVERYYLLAPSKHWNMSSMEGVMQLSKHILSATLDEGMYHVGLNKIFFRAGVLASFEQMRKNVLYARTRQIQTSWRKFHAQSRFQSLQRASLAIQVATRRHQAMLRFQTERVRRIALRLQTQVRAFLTRRRTNALRSTIVLLQTAWRAKKARQVAIATREAQDATGLQRLIRGALERRRVAQHCKKVVLVQSLYRRRCAKRAFAQRKTEAKSATHFQEVSYRLENKVVDLTQSLQTRTKENRELRAQLVDLQSQLATWQNRHEELGARARGLQEEVERPSVPTPKFEQIRTEGAQLTAQLDQAQERIIQLEHDIGTLQSQLNARMQEEQELAPDSVVQSLRSEIAVLREQLGRANALNAKNGGTVPLASAAARDGRRLSRRSADMSEGFEEEAEPDIYEPHVNPEEIIELLENEVQLDEDVLQGLVRYLKIPAPSLQNPPSMKEVLFPAHLISLVTNEMWKYGLVRESERFLANVMQTIQQHVMDFYAEEAVVPGIFWLSNVHEILSFVCIAESDMLQGVGPGIDGSARDFEWGDYERLVTIVKHDLDSLEYNIYHTFMQQAKKQLNKMVVPALVESQSLPGFITNDSGGRLLNRLLAGNHAPTYAMDDILGLLNKTWKCLKSYYVEPSVTQQAITELLKMIGVTSFNDLLMRRNFCSWKRAMQIQYNITRLEEWCKSHDMPEGSLQLEHLLQATKLLQLKKATMGDIDIIYDVCWMLTPTQIQKLISHYHVADYENPISPEILKAVASRVVPNDRNDHLLLPPEVDEAGPYELPVPREVTGIETYCPAYLNVPLLRNLASKVA
ncbi:Myosin type-2 heavy chain 1 [Malassezia vespertilionis]|uniref:Myosin type-2 heavy chain 1 n=1 Tax=Malassezia vespertilionis TaxID=2020962 RepID=UPI0024B12BED|nr:Myosin type-2 heavy chain 1 [Malassezia vespertilionis]WFD07005.1 Myosin type-2 heavy chain 1 [Malassezia vespertilionis]